MDTQAPPQPMQNQPPEPVQPVTVQQQIPVQSASVQQQPQPISTIPSPPQPQPIQSLINQPQQPPPPENTLPIGIITPQPQRPMLKIAIFIFILLGFLFCTTTYLYAYGYIPAGNKDFQESVSDFVQGLPLMPKTPQFVLKKAINAHRAVTKFSFDASLAAISQQTINIAGSSSFDMQVKGSADYTDIQKPIISLNANMPKLIYLDYLQKNSLVYFRLKELPAFVVILMNTYGIDSNAFLNQWFSYDVKPLPTDARKSLEAQEEKAGKNGSKTNKFVKDFFTTLNEPKIRKSIRMKNEKLGSNSMYHISFTPTDSALDIFWEKYLKIQYPVSEQPTQNQASLPQTEISKNISGFKMETWIDPKTYLVHKSTIIFTVKAYKGDSDGTSETYDPNSMIESFIGQSSDVNVSMVLNLSNYGKDVTFVPPEGAVNIEEFMKTITLKMATPSAFPSDEPVLTPQY